MRHLARQLGLRPDLLPGPRWLLKNGSVLTRNLIQPQEGIGHSAKQLASQLQPVTNIPIHALRPELSGVHTHGPEPNSTTHMVPAGRVAQLGSRMRGHDDVVIEHMAAGVCET